MDGIEWSKPSVLGKRRQAGGFHPFACETQRLPARIPVFQLVQRDEISDFEASTPTFSLQLPPQQQEGTRIREFMLKQSVIVAKCAHCPCDGVLRDHGCDGWMSVDGQTLQLLDAASILQLTDDDKHRGMSQAFLTDMFLRHSSQR
ncbi:hypothetical protein AB1Y20_022141 [Prymnesium parvum]|uniref:Uncharacterized protein n=1 Tax=Prymnesium parvum TaxID=97485 RepID=A0AB34JG05_PRYPA